MKTLSSVSSAQSITGTLLPRQKTLFLILLFIFLGFLFSGCSADPNLTAPGVTLTFDQENNPKQVTSGVQLLVLLTVLSIVPSILILGTCFTRIVIVLSMLRSAIGTPTIPPNQVILGLSLLLTFFIMAPVYQKVDTQAIQPYLKG
jgi:flagellar biosynthetic protein FliP